MNFQLSLEKKINEFGQKAKNLRKNENAHEIRKKRAGLCPWVVKCSIYERNSSSNFCSFTFTETMIRFILHIDSPCFITTCLCKSHCLPQYMTFQGKCFLIQNLPISSAEKSFWWNVKELCIDAAFFLLIRLSNWFLPTKIDMR